MAVNEKTPIIALDGNGTTTHFPFDFRALTASDVKVFVDGVELKPNEYTVTLNADKGGSVDLVKAPAAPAPNSTGNVMIRRKTAFKRDTDYQTNGSLLADTLDDDFDRLWLCLQEEQAASDTTLNKPVGATAWNAEGFQIENLKDGSAPQDAATYGQLTNTAASAGASATAAAASATESAHQKDLAIAAAQDAATQATHATDQADDALKRAEAAKLSEDHAKISEDNAADSATRAEVYSRASAQSAGFAYDWSVEAKQHADDAASHNPTASVVKSQNLADVADKAAALQNLLDNKPLPLPAAAVAPGDAIRKGEFDAALEQAGGGYVSQVIWHHSRNDIPAGYITGDGQEVDQAIAPSLYQMVVDGKVPVVSEADWWADHTKRGAYTLGATAGKFRVPDYNGGQKDSVPAPFMRGDLGGKNTVGKTYLNNAPNIIGEVSSLTAGGIFTGFGRAQGAFQAKRADPNAAGFGLKADALEQSGPTRFDTLTFDMSKSGQPGAEAYGRYGSNSIGITPDQVIGVMLIRFAGKPLDSGITDANTVATKLAQLMKDVQTMDKNIGYSLVQFGTVAKATRYVQPNPFGNSTAVMTKVEVSIDSGVTWFDPGWCHYTDHSAATASDGGYGVRAHFVSGEGIVVQTGSLSVAGVAASTGGASGSSAIIASALCRVHVWSVGQDIGYVRTEAVDPLVKGIWLTWDQAVQAGWVKLNIASEWALQNGECSVFVSNDRIEVQGYFRHAGNKDYTFDQANPPAGTVPGRAVYAVIKLPAGKTAIHKPAQPCAIYETTTGFKSGITRMVNTIGAFTLASGVVTGKGVALNDTWYFV